MTNPFPERPLEDEAVLRTDGSVDQTQAYQKAEHVFDPNNPPTAAPRNTGTNKRVYHETHQQETSEKEDPSKAVGDSDPTDIGGLQ